MRPFIPGLTALLLTACATTSAEPVIVEIGAARAPAATAATTAPAAPERPTQKQLLARLNASLRQSSTGETSIAIEARGRVVKRDTTDAYEEDFFIDDVAEIAYVHEPYWNVPHVARVQIKPGGVTRFRRGDEAWSTSTIPHVSFAFRDQRAAEDAVAALRALLKR